jgi:hypothetical protein
LTAPSAAPIAIEMAMTAAAGIVGSLESNVPTK